jgi:hypothetical protein
MMAAICGCKNPDTAAEQPAPSYRTAESRNAFPIPRNDASQPTENEARRIQADDAAIGGDEAIRLVRQMVESEAGTPVVANYDVNETATEYHVFVLFGSEYDKDGKVTGIMAGGHTMYVLSKRGQVLRVIGGL